jgi:hypothetical protein
MAAFEVDIADHRQTHEVRTTERLLILECAVVVAKQDAGVAVEVAAGPLVDVEFAISAQSD